MRDRRNTHVSSASVSSSSSADSSAIPSARTSLHEKDIECQSGGREKAEYDDAKLHHTMPRAKRPFLFYLMASVLLLLLYVGHNVQRDLSATASSSPKGTNQPHGFDWKQPAGVPIIDGAGHDRWTVYIPESKSFPLSYDDYGPVCRDATRLQKESWRWLPWWPARSSYMDVDEAKSLDLLPSRINTTSSTTCQSSLTFVMDTSESSFGKMLLMFWLSYGIAKREHRAFFIDDLHWTYGSYNSYFPPLPRPGCSRPPPSHIVPCPLEAKHLVVTPLTIESLLKSSRYQKQMSSKERQDSVFDILRSGYQSTFSLIGEDAAYAGERVTALRQIASEQHKPLVGMHLRRGDLHPFELQFSQDYLPVERYTDAAKRLLGSSSHGTAIVLASDDPDIIDSPEVALAAAPHHLYKSQERIQLATKLALDRSMPSRPIQAPGSAYTKHVDENAGWDGGFYAALFWSLGDPRSRSDRLKQPVRTLALQKDALRMRELVGRGYLLDLEVLSHMDGVACAVSSAACRILGVMMGKEAVLDHRWVNVDDNRSWSWDGRK